MTSPPESPTSVGQQLRERREALDLTQPALARRIGIDSSTVSVTERGHTAIQRGRRAAWEAALHLKPGTISRAYTHGDSLEPLDEPSAATPYADLSDPHERAVWEMTHLSEEDRRAMIDILRADRAQPRPRSA